MAVPAAWAQGTDAQLLLCCCSSSHQSYLYLYEGDLQTTLSLK